MTPTGLSLIGSDGCRPDFVTRAGSRPGLQGADYTSQTGLRSKEGCRPGLGGTHTRSNTKLPASPGILGALINIRLASYQLTKMPAENLSFPTLTYPLKTTSTQPNQASNLIFDLKIIFIQSSVINPSEKYYITVEFCVREV